MIQLRPIGLGCGASLALAALSRAFLEVHSEYALLLSGFIGGIVTAIAVNAEADSTWKNNVHNGFLASGLSGLTIFGFMVAFTLSDQLMVTPSGASDDIVLFLTMSPLVIPTFAVAGALGGLIGSGIHALVTSTR